MKRELNGILAVLQGKRRMTEEYDWHYMLGTLLMNRVGIPFYLSARKTQSGIPRQVERFFEELLIQQRRRNGVMEKWIADLSYEFHSSELKYAFLKGSVLSYCKFGGKMLYGLGERVSNDIDILVSPEDLGKVDDILTGLGFRQGKWDLATRKIVPFTRKEIVFRRMTRGETAPYMIGTQSDELPYVEVDVNFSLGYLPSGDKDLVKEMLRDCKSYPFSGGGALTSFSEEKFLLHLIMHQYKEATLYWMAKRRKDSQLYKYLDIYRVLESDTVCSERFIRSVKAAGLCNEVCYVLSLCDRLFPCNAVQSVLEKLRSETDIDLFSVTDAENHATYRWQKDVFERVGCYDRKRNLKKM